MGAIYLGLSVSDGYLFATNDMFGEAFHECAIVEINQQCGALIVTARGNFLRRVRRILDQCLIRINDKVKGLAEDFAGAIVASMKTTFENDPSYKAKPLPFLLLLVGNRSKQPMCRDYIFVRNRVVERLGKGHSKEYLTEFDIQHIIPAINLFYGHSELAQFLCQNLPGEALNLEAAKLLAYLAISETQNIDLSIFSNIRLAILSAAEGFKWIQEDEILRVAETVERINEDFTEGLRCFFNDSCNYSESSKNDGNAMTYGEV